MMECRSKPDFRECLTNVNYVWWRPFWIASTEIQVALYMFSYTRDRNLEHSNYIERRDFNTVKMILFIQYTSDDRREATYAGYRLQSMNIAVLFARVVRYLHMYAYIFCSAEQLRETFVLIIQKNLQCTKPAIYQCSVFQSNCFLQQLKVVVRALYHYSLIENTYSYIYNIPSLIFNKICFQTHL